MYYTLFWDFDNIMDSYHIFMILKMTPEVSIIDLETVFKVILLNSRVLYQTIPPHLEIAQPI